VLLKPKRYYPLVILVILLSPLSMLYLNGIMINILPDTKLGFYARASGTIAQADIAASLKSQAAALGANGVINVNAGMAKTTGVAIISR